MPIDPSIPLQAGQPSGPFGPDLKQIFSLQKMAQEMQARQLVMQQEQQGQNALRQVFGNPQSIDPATGLPRPQALGPVIQAYPELGMNLLRDIGKTRETDLRTQLLGQKVQDEHRNWAIDQIAVPAVAKYREVLQQSGNQQLAQTEAQKVYSEALANVKADGRLGSAASQLLPTFDYSNATANILGRKGLEKAAEMDLKAQEPPTPYQKGRLEIEQQRADQEALRDIARQQADRKKGGLASAKEITVFDDKGDAVESIAAVDDPDPTNPSKLKHFGTDSPVVVPPGGHIGVGKSTVAILGSRESQMLQRQLGSGVQASKAIKDIVALPQSATRGTFGGRQQGHSLLDAAKETVANTFTTQTVQAYNAITPGLTRSLALIDSQGLSPGQNFTDSFKAEMLAEGDTGITKLLKLARQREIVDGGMETLLTNPRLGKEQKDKAQAIMDSMKEAIPWTPIDVIQLMNAPPGTSLRDLGVGKVEVKPVQAETDPEKAKKQWADAPSGTVFVDQYGNRYPKP